MCSVRCDISGKSLIWTSRQQRRYTPIQYCAMKYWPVATKITTFVANRQEEWRINCQEISSNGRLIVSTTCTILQETCLNFYWSQLNVYKIDWWVSVTERSTRTYTVLYCQRTGLLLLLSTEQQTQLVPGAVKYWKTDTVGYCSCYILNNKHRQMYVSSR